MTDNALKPCPFCGSDLVLVHETDWSTPPTWSAHCCNKECPLNGAKFTRAAAIAAWNTRTPTPTPPASDQVERVAEEYAKKIAHEWMQCQRNKMAMPLSAITSYVRAAIAAIRDTKGGV